MQKRKRVTYTVVGMAALLLGSMSPTFVRASDPPSSAKDQKATSAETAARSTTDANDQVSGLKQQMALQQKQIEQLQKALEEQKQLLERVEKTASSSQTMVAPAPAAQQVASPQIASITPIIPKGLAKPDNSSVPLSAIPAARVATPAKAEGSETSPLQFRIGDAAITPVGFMDFTSVFRTHAAGGSIGTSFGSIPYGTSAYQNNLTEMRLSMQNSRIGFRVDADVKGAHVIGYMEADFLGNNPANVAVSSNSNTMRSRLYWVDVQRGKWEILGGQTWSLITPGRSGISPLPSNLFYTQDIDVNYQAGLFWGRIPELRFVYHPSKKVAFAVALDSPDQYAGGSSGGPLIALPPSFASSTTTAYQGELDYNQNGLNAPNLAPDIIAKLAFDPVKRFHFEIGGVERNFKVYNPSTAKTFTSAGGGGFANLGFDLFKGFRILTNNYVSDGGGRYIFGQVPDTIVKADGSLSLIHANSTVTGLEYTHKNSMVYAYYGGIYAQRNTGIVPITTTSGGVTTTTLTPFGYGYKGASTSQNRAIQEATFGFNQTIWKDAKWGAVNFMGQYSYLARDPWYTTAGNPSNASLNMLFFNLRYTLPGSAPTLGK